MSPNFPMVGLRPGEGFDFYNNTITMADPNTGQLVKMDLGQNDVHVDAALSQFVTGYKNAEFVADKVSAPVVVNKASNRYFAFDPSNALAPVDGTQVAAGASYPTLMPKLSNLPYQTLGYTLGSILPTELLANQDAPLNLQRTAARMCRTRLGLNRELRVKTKAFTSANFSSSQVVTCISTTKWNGGGSSNPIRDIRQIIEGSLAPVTHMAMDRRTWHAFTENPAVQKYVSFKSGAAPLPQKNQYEEWASLLDMPIPVIAEAKALDSTGAYPYVWSGSVVLFRATASDSDEEDIPTFKTFRWSGAGAPRQNDLPVEAGGSVVGGWIVRAFFNPYQGPQGTHVVVVTHNDDDVVTGGPSNVAVVGGLIVNAWQ